MQVPFDDEGNRGRFSRAQVALPKLAAYSPMQGSRVAMLPHSRPGDAEWAALAERKAKPHWGLLLTIPALSGAAPAS